MFKILAAEAEENNDESCEDCETLPSIANLGISVVGLYGPVEESSCAGAIFAILQYVHILEELEEEDVNKQIPFTFYISTAGGNTEDMFALYDVIEHAKSKGVIIKTVGVGKVFSAGVPLLSAGTVGYRFLGKNCRILLHDISVDGSMIGDLQHITNEIKEIKLAKKKYYDILKETSAVNDKMIKQILKKKVNYYFSAEEAIKYSIADHIL